MTPPSKFDPDWVVAPGETLREWREENRLGVTSAATACGRMSPETFAKVESGQRRITSTIAAQLEAGTGIPAYLWRNLERAFRSGLAAGKAWTP